MSHAVSLFIKINSNKKIIFMEYITRNVAWKMCEVIFALSIDKVSARTLSPLLNSTLQKRSTLAGGSPEVN